VKRIILFSIRRQIAAIDILHERGMYFFDYGNAFLITAKRAGKIRIDHFRIKLLFLKAHRSVEMMTIIVFVSNIHLMFKILWEIYSHLVLDHLDGSVHLV
jgi:urocanate hydratase